MRWLIIVPIAAAALHASPSHFTVEQRLAILHRAGVWTARDIARADPRVGPQERGAFAPEELVTCDFVDKPQTGRSPKFTCALSPDDRVKVKYGRENGEVYAEVAATRLLWMLGFAADRMYPVRVLCRNCPPRLGGEPTADPGTFEFAVSAVERPLPGREVTLERRRGWEWGELDIAKASAGGATRAQRDALKLLAVMIQHTDSKSEQQRLICPDDQCAHPVAMINDLGMTFGHASMYNRDAVSSVNLDQWSRSPVWLSATGCIGNLTKSSTGSLDRPRISEEGRAFLADLLGRVSDRQIHDLFAVARFDRRRGDRIADWVQAFKHKRDEISARRCEN